MEIGITKNSPIRIGKERKRSNNRQFLCFIKNEFFYYSPVDSNDSKVGMTP